MMDPGRFYLPWKNAQGLKADASWCTRQLRGRWALRCDRGLWNLSRARSLVFGWADCPGMAGALAGPADEGDGAHRERCLHEIPRARSRSRLLPAVQPLHLFAGKLRTSSQVWSGRSLAAGCESRTSPYRSGSWPARRNCRCAASFAGSLDLAGDAIVTVCTPLRSAINEITCENYLSIAMPPSTIAPSRIPCS
jgi:hypothetical protein